nr:4Fe-4S binding protein [Propionibacterium sp.]
MAKGRVAFDRDLCKGCGLCVSVCPEHMLELDTATINRKGYHPAHVVEGREDDCIGCALCAVMCPDQVITVEKF